MPSNDACNFSTLGAYNNNSCGINIVPVSNLELKRRQINFSFRAPGFNTLSVNNTPYNCSGFASISSAYNRLGNNCNQQYIRRICN